MLKNKKSDYLISAFPLCSILLYFAISSVLISTICKVDVAAAAFDEEEEAWDSKVGPFVPRDQRRTLVSTEYGEISAAKVTDGINGSYYLQFIKLEPNALFLPVILHADMVFYVQTGSGRLGLINEDGGEENGKKKGDKARTQGVDIQRGDVYSLPPGTVFFIQSSLEPERHKLRICAIFANSEHDHLREPVIGPYSSIRDLVLGFDKKVLQAAFQVPEEVVEEMTSSKKPLAIVHGVPKSSRTLWEVEAQFVEALFGRKKYNMFDVNKKKGKSRGYNILTGDRDVHNCNGWSSTVTGKQLRSLRGSSIGIFMVNLTKGAMMGPHWNPMATEIAIVLEGQGMVQVVCPFTASETECTNKRIRAQEGDVFLVPRFHPMAQMSFNNGSFVFVGFTTTNWNNHPQFLAGKSSVLQTLDKQVLAESFNVSNSTISQLLAPQRESIILECASCAEEEERLLEEEIDKEKDKARKREEEKRKQEEEEARKREEEKKKEEEEARKREEEEKKRKEQEAAARKREEEEEARKAEEEQAQAEEAKREAEKAKKREEEEEAKKREEEAQEEEARRREEEKRRQEAAKEEARRKEQEEERQRKERQQQEDERRRKAAIREAAAARQQEEEMEKQQQEEGGGPDRRQKEKEREKQQQGGGGGGGGGQEGTEAEQKEARRKEEEAQRGEETKRQAAVKEAAARKKEEEARRSKEEAQEEGRGRKSAAAARKEEAARQQQEEEEEEEEERGGGKHKQQKEKEREKQQQEGGAGSRGQEETEAEQQEAQFWLGGPEKGELF